MTPGAARFRTPEAGRVQHEFPQINIPKDHGARHG